MATKRNGFGHPLRKESFALNLERAHIAEVDRAMRQGYSREEAELFVAMAWNSIVARLRDEGATCA